MNYGFLSFCNKMGHQRYKTVSKLPWRHSSELISKWLEGSCDESESEIEVIDSPDSYIYDESDNENINFVAPDKLLDDAASLNLLRTC